MGALLGLLLLAPIQGALLVRGGKVVACDEAFTVFDPGAVLVEGARIAWLGPAAEAPAAPGARVLEAEGAWVVPGFVELHAHIGLDAGGSGDTNDMVHPNNPELRVLDALHLDSEDWADAISGGVTTTLVIPGSGSNVSGLGALVKTAGGSLEERLVRFPGALKAALFARGGNPSRGSGELGLARMGLHFLMRRFLAEVREAAARPRRGRDPMAALARREFPVIFHAYAPIDTRAAIRMVGEEAGLWAVLSHCTYDSFKIADILAALGYAANVGPRNFWFEDGRLTGNAAGLAAGGVRVSVNTDSPVVPQEELSFQAAKATRFGLSDREALLAVTRIPAETIGVGDRLGTLEPGKDADLAVWSGDPLDPRSRPLFVVVNGRVVFPRGGAP